MTRSARLIGTKRPAISGRGLAVSPWVLVDPVIWAAMFALALWVRFDFNATNLTASLGMGRFYLLVFAAILLTWVFGWTNGLYRGRYWPGSLLENAVLALLLTGVTILVFFGHLGSGEIDGIPRSVPLIAGVFTILSTMLLRSFVRRRELFGAGARLDAEPVIVYGAGDGGAQLVSQLRRSQVSQYRPVAILDDDPSKWHMVLDGVRVTGGRDQLENLAKKTNAATLLVAIPSLSRQDLVEIRDRAEFIGMHVLVLPPLDTIMRGRVAANELRQINVDDLLGRKPARLNQTQIAEYIRGKRVMVTGAGGSIGSELCRQLLVFRPSEMMMLDRDESGLHSTQLSIQEQAMLDGDDTILASIRDEATIRDVFLKRRPEIVFHAAALKHMPLLEHYPLEALKTNVIGTMHLLDAAAESGVETFVNISTDKAANPCSVLGNSKRIAERLTASRARQEAESTYVSVRFGNVLGSRGSVLTVFEKQIQEGGPVTVTDPAVERFFMTIAEACQLVLQAAAVGRNGETMVLDMGEPVKIEEVARTLIEQSGKRIEIVYTGLRENEKMSEELIDGRDVVLSEVRHESLSQVRVPPLRIDESSLRSIETHERAKSWLEEHAHGRGDAK